MMKTDWLMNLSLLWRGASEVFPYFDQRDLDLDEAFATFLPQMAAVEGEREAYMLLAKFAALLGDGHTDVTLPKALRDEIGYLPFRLKHIGDHWHIAAVMEASRHLLLSKVERLNGEDFQALLERVFAHIHHVGGHASHTRLEQFLPLFLQPIGNLLETSGGSMRFDLVPQPPAMAEPPAPEPSAPWRELTRTQSIRVCLLDDNVLYVSLANLLYASAAKTILEAAQPLPHPRGIILDLRGCIGGVTLFGAKIARLLIPGEFHACRKWTRTMQGSGLASAIQIGRMSAEDVSRLMKNGMSDQEELQKSLRVSRRSLFSDYTDSFGQPGDEAFFDQPCLLLTDRDTLSAAEDMTAMFRSNQRATILGERTYGSTGTPLLLPLRGGGMARVVSVGYRLLDGTEFINRGIQPDVSIAPSAEDLLAGRDIVLDEAIKRLA